MRLAAPLLACFLGVLAAPAPILAADPPAGMVDAEGGLRHEATGIRLPKWLKGLRRNLSGGDAVVAIYTPSRYHRIEDLNVAAGVGAVRTAMDLAALRHEAWEEMGRIATPVAIAETGFSWPGHPDAATFYGSYWVGRFRKTYWLAWEKGWQVLVTVTTLRSNADKNEELSGFVAREIFGGAAVEPAPAP
jgi:hypothetical protein